MGISTIENIDCIPVDPVDPLLMIAQYSKLIQKMTEL